MAKKIFAAKTFAAVLLCSCALALGGCELAALAMGSGSKPALYKFEKNKRILVLVDVKDTVTPPPTFATTLADKIGAHLIRYKAADNLVSQSALVDLQQRDPAAFKKMSMADIARALGADVVLDVYLTQLDIPITTDGNASLDSDGEAYVKVVSRDGNRLFPGEENGSHVTAHVNGGLLSDQAVPDIQKQLLDQFALVVGRMFHSYSLDDKDMLVSPEDRKLIGQ